MFEEGHSVCSKQNIPCVPSRKFLVFETKHSLWSKQDIPCVRSRTFLLFQAGHSLCSKQDIPYVPGRTFLVFEAIHFLCSSENHEKSFQLQTYWSYPLKFVIFRARFFKAHDAMVSSDVVFLGSMLSQARHFLRSKQDIPCVPTRKRLKNREDGSDFHDFLTKSIASPRTFFWKFSRRRKIFRVVDVVVVVVVVVVVEVWITLLICNTEC